MSKRILVLGLTLLGVAALNLSACGSKAVDNNTLVIGMECAYQPFNWTEAKANDFTLPINGTNEFADGYDIAVAKYLAEDLSRPVVIKRIEWGDLIPSLENGSINMVLAGMSSTAERRKTIDFTDPYLESDLAFLIKTDNLPVGNSKTNPASYQDLLSLFDGKKLICQSGVVGEDIIDDYFVNAEGVSITHAAPLPTYPLAALDVQQGLAFAMPAELPVIEAMANLDGLSVLYCDYSFLSESDLEGLKVNIGIKKGNDELRNDLNASLAKLSQEQRSQMMGAASQRSAA